MMRTLLGLERPQRNLPMGSSAPSRRSKVAILLRKMSEQSGRFSRSRTPKILPACASLPLISAERDGHFADATFAAPRRCAAPWQGPAASEPKTQAAGDVHAHRLERPQGNLPMNSSTSSKRSKVVILLRKMNGQFGRLKRPRTPEVLPAGASLSLISAERDGHFAGATLAAPRRCAAPWQGPAALAPKRNCQMLRIRFCICSGVGVLLACHHA